VNQITVASEKSPLKHYFRCLSIPHDVNHSQIKPADGKDIQYYHHLCNRRKVFLPHLIILFSLAMEPAGRKSRYFRYILLTFCVLMVLEFSLNIFGIASFKLNSSLWRQFNATQFISGGEADGGEGGGGGGGHVGGGGGSEDGGENENNEGDRDISPRLNDAEPVVIERSIEDIMSITTAPQRQKDLFPSPRKTQGSSSARDPSIEASSTTVVPVDTTTTTSLELAPTLPICPDPPPKLVGLLRVVKKPMSLETCVRLHSTGLGPGGFFKPPGCVARHRVAIVIPFRDREEHLHIFLNHLLPILKRQLVEFQIYVVDLVPGVKFNRAMLMNIGYAESIKQHDWQCFVFHDVDLLPENDKNIYSCPDQPRHMSAAVDTMHYKLPYKTIFGGVSALSRSQFETINGFSNRFFGWGGEDDDIYNRIHAKGYKISRYPMNVARYSMITHKKDTPNPERYKLLNSGVKRMSWDGINSLKYKVIKIDKAKLFTRIIVSINEKEVMKAKGKSKP